MLRYLFLFFPLIMMAACTVAETAVATVPATRSQTAVTAATDTTVPTTTPSATNTPLAPNTPVLASQPVTATAVSLAPNIAWQPPPECMTSTVPTTPLCTSFKISADGQWLTFLASSSGSEATLRLVHLLTGEYKQVPSDMETTTALLEWLTNNNPHSLLSLTDFMMPVVDWQQLPECLPPTDEALLESWKPCQGFELSPDGVWLIFHAGPGVCQQPLTLVNLKTGERRSLAKGASGPEKLLAFLPHNGLLFQMAGGCHTNVGIAHYHLDSGQWTDLLAGGSLVWNEPHTAFYVIGRIGHDVLPRQYIWGYYPEEELVFLPQVFTEHRPYWLDETHLIYQQQPKSLDHPIEIGPGTIEVVHITSGEVQTRLADELYDFHPCDWTRPQNEEINTCFEQENWVFTEDGWLRVERIPTQAGIYEITADAPFPHPELNCAHYYPPECNIPVARFLFNWQTGEVKQVDL